MARSRLSRLSRISCWRAVTAGVMSGADERRDTSPASNLRSVRGPVEAATPGEVAPDAVLFPPAETRSVAPPGPALGRRSTSMYASRLCWRRSWSPAPVMALGEVLKVLPPRPTAGAADAPPVVRALPLLSLGETVAWAEPAPGPNALRLSSTGPRCPSRERSVDSSWPGPLRAAASWCDTPGRHGLTCGPVENDREEGAPSRTMLREPEWIG